MTSKPATRRFALIGWMTAVLLFCLTATASADPMVTNGGFDAALTPWSGAGTYIPAYSTLQNHGTLTGAGSALVTWSNRQNATYTSTLTQSVSIAPGSVINTASIWARGTNATGGAATGISISLRYQDATSATIVTGTITNDSTWRTLSASPALTLPQAVNQITVTYTTYAGATRGNGSFYVDDVAIDYTPAGADTMSVSSNTAVATTGDPGQADVQMEYIIVNSNATGNGNITLTSVTVDDLNIATTGTIANLKVHIDTDANYLNGTLGAKTIANWNGQSTVIDLTTGTSPSLEDAGDRVVTSGTAKYIWILYDIDAAAVDLTIAKASVTAIGVAAPDNPPTGGPWDSNSVLITTGLGCGGCHPNPMVDTSTTPRDPATGGVQGDHTKHAAGQGYDCILCHLATPETPRHRDSFIAIVDPIQNVANATYTTTGKTGVITNAGVSKKWPQSTTPVRGTCQNTLCHGGLNTAGNYGGPVGNGPLWGSDSADACTFCHNANKTNSGGLPNSHPTAASPFRSTAAAGAHALHMDNSSGIISGGVLCSDCHTDYATITTAGHVDVNVGAPADVPFPVGSDARLNTTTPIYNTTNKTCSVYCHGFKMPYNSTNGTDRTPAWITNWATNNYYQSSGCNATCHGLPPTTSIHNAQAYPGSCKTCHAATVTTTVAPVIINAANHINGAVEATGCSGCHGGGTTGTVDKNYWPDNSTGHAANVEGRHVEHMTVLVKRVFGLATLPQILNDASSGTKQKQLCDYCHQATTNDGDHQAQTLPADVFPVGYRKMMNNAAAPGGVADAGGIAAYSSNQHGAGGTDTCSNVDCHNEKALAGATFGWYGSSTSTCMICHTAAATANNPSSGLHNVTPTITNTVGQHDNSFGAGGTLGCTNCHNMVAGMITNQTGTHINAAFTANGSITNNFTAMALNAAVYTATADNTGNCSATGTGCHGIVNPGRDDWKHQWISTANYYTNKNTSCKGCHGDWDGGWNTGVIHRISNEVNNNHGDGGTDWHCKECHNLEDSSNTYIFNFTGSNWAENAGETTSKHGNGAIEINNASGTVYNATTGLCNSSCHSTQDGVHNFADSGWVINYIVGSGAPAGSGGCVTCHGADAATSKGLVTSEHAGAVNATHSHIANISELTDDHCKACHLTDAVSPNAQTMSTGSTNRDVIILRDADTNAVIIMNQNLAKTNATHNLNNVTFCTKCHDAGGATNTASRVPTGTAARPFGTTSLWRAAVPDIANMYNSTVTATTHAYTYNNTPILTKARSPHGKPGTNDMKQSTEQSTYTDAAPVGCHHCHPGHGSTVNNTKTANYNKGGITIANVMVIANYSEPGTCWGCHNNPAAPSLTTRAAVWVKDYYGDTTTLSAANGNWNTGTTPAGGLNNSAFTYKQRALRSSHQVKASTISTVVSNASTPTTTDMLNTNIACSICHNPHGAQSWNGTSGSVSYYAFALRGTWMTSPYLEDRACARTGTAIAQSGGFAGYTGVGTQAGPRTESLAAYNRPATLGGGYDVTGGSGHEGYYIDDNTFGVTGGTYTITAGPTHTPPTVTYMSQTSQNFAGLCASCHTDATFTGSGADAAARDTNMKNFLKTRNNAGWTGGKIHQTVKGWVATPSTEVTDIVNSTNNPRMHALQSGASGQASPWGVASTGCYVARNGFTWGVNLQTGTKQAYHQFSCSKCHTPHASSLPRLLTSNCIDVGTSNTAQKAHGSDTGYTYPNWSASGGGPAATIAGVAGNMSELAIHCHNKRRTNTSGGSGWNSVSGW